MRFWDTSAIVPLLLEEESSSLMLATMAEDPYIVTSAFTVVEIASAIWRRRHAGELSLPAHLEAERLFADVSRTWIELPIDHDAIATAVDAISRSHLRAGDALQLGTAIARAGDLPFVTLDEDLAMAARNAGFTVLP